MRAIREAPSLLAIILAALVVGLGWTMLTDPVDNYLLHRESVDSYTLAMEVAIGGIFMTVAAMLLFLLVRRYKHVREYFERVGRSQHNLAISLGTHLPLVEALRLVLAAAVEVAEMECGAIYLIDPASGRTMRVIPQGLGEEFLAAVFSGGGEALCGSLGDGQPFYASVAARGHARMAPLAAQGFKAAALVPSCFGGRAVAFIGVASRQLEEVPLEVRGMLEAMASQVSSVIVRIQIHEALERSERFLSNVFSSIQDGISVLDTDLRILRVNPTMERWYAHAAPLVGRHCYSSYHGLAVPCESCPTARTLASGEVANGVVPLVGEGGERRGWLEVFSFPLRDDATGRVTGAIEYARDITDRRHVEAQLKGYSENLERMIEERTQELDRTRGELFASAKLAAMGRLGTGIAHQLNGPLGGSMLLLDALTEECRGMPQPLRMLGETRRALEQMNLIIEGMLSLASIRRRGRPARVAVTLNSMIDGIVNMLLLECHRHGVTVEKDYASDLPPIEAAMGEFDQVFLNLITNAIDAMEEGGRLIVRTRAHPRGAEVHVIDTGRGIEPEHLDRIFEPFFTTRQDKKGLGLGLAIVREIIDRYGGEICVKSRVGMGSEFVVVIPRSGGGADRPAAE